MHFAIPSKGRPTKIKSAKVLPGASVYVPASEVPAYERCGVHHLVAVPMSIHGITATRNWILDHVPDPWVVMMDDDLMTVGWVRLDEETTTRFPLTEAIIHRECEKLADLADTLGYRIFGPATQSAPRAVYPWKPFLWRSYVTASCMGIANWRGTRFDPSYPLKEDYELCLRCLTEDGGIVAARHWFWQNSHWSDAGGCANDRTRAKEEEAIRRLRETYPGMVRQVTRGGSPYSLEMTV